MTISKNITPGRLTVLFWCGIVFAAVFLLFADSLPNRFAFDDKSLIVENSFLKQKPSLHTVFTTNYRAGGGNTGDGLYRPLVVLSYIWNAPDPGSPFPFHLFNVTLNAVNAVLFFLLVLRLFAVLPLAVFAAFLFGFHPVHTEAVANIAGRPELMFTAFLLGAWLVRERYGERNFSIPLSSILFFAALLSKETAVLYPFMIIVMDAVLRRTLRSGRRLAEYASLFTVAGAYLVVRWFVLGDTAAGLVPDFVDNPIFHATAVSRIATALGVFTRYILLLFAPVRLSSDYSFNQIPVLDSPAGILPLAGLLVLAGIVYAAARFRNRSAIPFAAVLFLFPWLLVSNLFFPIGTIMGERLMYLPAGGFSLAAALLFTRFFSARKRTVLAVFSILLVLFAAKTASRNRDWRDDETLFSTDVRTSPESVKVLCNLGFLIGKNGRTLESMEYFRKALEIKPDYSEALRGYGKRLYDLKRYDESIGYYARAVEASPNDSNCRDDYGIVLSKIERFDEAEEQFAVSIRLKPANPLPYQEMSGVMIGKAEYGKAIEFLGRASALGGDRRIILNNTAVAEFLGGNPEAAYRTLRTAESEGIEMNAEFAAAVRAWAAQR